MIAPPRARSVPIVLVVGLVIIIAALLYAAINRSHQAPQQNVPMHQSH